MTGRGKKPAAPKKKANGYKMPPPIPLGEIISDVVTKKKWQIGPSIGVGGFGEIYSACEYTGSPKKGAKYPFVIKIEPHENGPLFVEKHFYIKNTNKNDIAAFMKKKKLTSLGMPSHYGTGSHEYKGEKYRYLVLERYGSDVWSLFKKAGHYFSTATVFQLGLQMLDVIEYIHSRGYVHADIKGANILVGMKKGTENQAYLVDYGLATRLNDKEFKPDPKTAHNGTIEYTSRDAHQGVATMRGDLEILGYNMLRWLLGAQPWEAALRQPRSVHAMKDAFMADVRASLAGEHNVPEALIKFLEHINALKPKETPDYAKCQQLFETYLKSQGKTRYSKLDFSPGKLEEIKTVKNTAYNGDADTTENGDAPKTKKRGRKPKAQQVEESDNDEVDAVTDKEKPKPKRGRKKAKSPVPLDDCEKAQQVEESDNNEVDAVTDKEKPKPKRGRKKAKSPEPLDDCENEKPDEPNKKVNVRQTRKAAPQKVIVEESDDDEDDDEIPDKPDVRRSKRKSLEHTVAQVKKTRLTPKATPPAKRNHANIATQTSVDRPRRSPRQVSFESPICEIIGEKKSRNESLNSSGDIFEDSFTIEEKKIKPKRKLYSTTEVTVKRVVKRK